MKLKKSVIKKVKKIIYYIKEKYIEKILKKEKMLLKKKIN